MIKRKGVSTKKLSKSMVSKKSVLKSRKKSTIKKGKGKKKTLKGKKKKKVVKKKKSKSLIKLNIINDEEEKKSLPNFDLSTIKTTRERNNEDKEKEALFIIESLMFFEAQFKKFDNKNVKKKFSPFNSEEIENKIKLKNKEEKARIKKRKEIIKNFISSLIEDNIINPKTKNKNEKKMPNMSTNFLSTFKLKENENDFLSIESDEEDKTIKQQFKELNNPEKKNRTTSFQVKNVSNRFIMNLPDNDVMKKHFLKPFEKNKRRMTHVQSFNKLENEVSFKIMYLFKKILVYSSKIEELKNEIFLNNDKFDLIAIFEIYDEDEIGKLKMSAFSRFIDDINLELTKSSILKLICYLNQIHSNSKFTSDQEKVQFIHFTKLFYPIKKDNLQLLNNFFEILKNKTNEEITANLVITNYEFEFMKEIILLFITKLEDLTIIIKSLKKFSTKEIYSTITGGNFEDINLKVIKGFLYLNNVKFIDEDVEHIFRVFKGKSFDVISFQDFADFLENPIWEMEVEEEN